MRILHLTHTDIRYDNRIIKEIECLTSIYDVFGIGIDYDEGSALNSTELFKDKLFTLQLKFRKKVNWLPRFIIHLLVFIELLWKSIKIIKNINPRVLHCHDTLVLPIGYIYKLINPKVKLIYDAHELESNKNGQGKFLGFVTKQIEKISWRKIDFLITVSPSINNWYLKNFGFVNSEVILNSPKIKNFNTTQTSKKYFHEKYQLKPNTKVFVYLGALVKGRYIEQLVEIFQKYVSQSVIVFIGFGELKELVEFNSLNFDTIKYHEPVTHDEVVETIVNADYGLCLIENVSLSDFYCLPNKLFEYIFAKKKVLASNFPDISNLVNEYNLGKCCDLNLDSIKNAILSMESDELTDITTNLHELSWENQEFKLKMIYKNIV